MRNRRPRLVVGVLLAALVLVPVLEGTHGHGDLDRGVACATCAAAQHAPQLITPVVVMELPGVVELAELPRIESLVAAPVLASFSTRAPPAPSASTHA